MKHQLRVAHIIEWDNAGQAFFALIDGQTILARFGFASEARAAYRAAIAQLNARV